MLVPWTLALASLAMFRAALADAAGKLAEWGFLAVFAAMPLAVSARWGSSWTRLH